MGIDRRLVPKMRGQFIVIEGTDGAGTSTQSQLLAEWLRARGIEEVLETHEPTNRPVGTLIRSVLREQFELPWNSTAMLFAADRLDHCQNVIEPALRRGAWVISDRYTLSSYIYQTLAFMKSRQALETPVWLAHYGISALQWVMNINASATKQDITLVLSVSAEVAKQRRLMRAGKDELFEYDAFQAAVCGAYQEPARWGAEEFSLIDASEPTLIVHERITKLVEPFLDPSLEARA